METTERSMEILRHLIAVNNGLISGLEQAAGDLKEQDSGLLAVLTKLADNSRSYSNQLSALAREEGLAPDAGRNTSGMNDTFIGNAQEAILAKCDREVRALKDAYTEGLAHPNNISPECYNLLTYQLEGIRQAHDRIASLREPGGFAKQSDPAAQEIAQVRPAELQPGYEKQNIPGMEPPDHFPASAAAAATNPSVNAWNLSEKPVPFKDTFIDFSEERAQTKPENDPPAVPS